MKRFEFTEIQLSERATKTCDKILERMHRNLRYEIIYDGNNKVKAYFQGQVAEDDTPNHIELWVGDVTAEKGPQKLRDWNAGIVIAFIHECCHWFFFEELKPEERVLADSLYEEIGHLSDLEEWQIWDRTVQWLKTLGYMRSEHIRRNLKKFIVPRGYEFKLT